MNLVDIPLQHAHYKTQSDNWSVALFYCISGQFIFWSFVYSLSSWMELVFGHFIDAWNDLPLYNYWLVPTIIIIVLCKMFKQSIHLMICQIKLNILPQCTLLICLSCSHVLWILCHELRHAQILQQLTDIEGASKLAYSHCQVIA